MLFGASSFANSGFVSASMEGFLGEGFGERSDKAVAADILEVEGA